jgi:hypothetical protein
MTKEFHGCLKELHEIVRLPVHIMPHNGPPDLLAFSAGQIDQTQILSCRAHSKQNNHLEKGCKGTSLISALHRE